MIINAGIEEVAYNASYPLGEVSLALSGTGRGWDLGIAFGKLTIRRA